MAGAFVDRVLLRGASSVCSRRTHDGRCVGFDRERCTVEEVPAVLTVTAGDDEKR